MNACRNQRDKSFGKSDVIGDKSKVDFSNPRRNLDVVGLGRKGADPVTDLKMPARTILKKGAVGPPEPVANDRNAKVPHAGTLLKRSLSHGSSQSSDATKLVGEMIPVGRRRDSAVAEVRAANVGERRSTVSGLPETQEQSGMTARRTIRRVRREISERTLETTFSEISGDDLTVESSMACLYAESEDIVIEEEINYGYSADRNTSHIPPVVDIESQNECQQNVGAKQSRRTGRRQSIGNVSICVNIAPPPDTGQSARRSRRHSISNVTVQVNFGQSNVGSYTVNTMSLGSGQPANSGAHQKPILTLENPVSASSTVVATSSPKEGSDSPVSVINRSDTEGDYNYSESEDGVFINQDEMNASSLEGLVANISVQLNQEDDSETDSYDESICSFTEERPIESEGIQKNIVASGSNLSTLRGSTTESSASVKTAAADTVPKAVIKNQPLLKMAASTTQNARECDNRPSLSNMSRKGLVDLVRSNENADYLYSKSTRTLRAGSMESSARVGDPLGSSTHSYKAETSQTVDAYETAVSMQNIGLHNRYGFMVDDREVKRSSSRKRNSLSFNTLVSESQEISHAQTRNHSEPASFRKADVKYPPSASKSFHLSNHSLGRNQAITGSGRYGPRPPMQKSMSTRSLTKRSLLNRRSSSRSITQSQTIAENAQMVDETPYVSQTNLQQYSKESQETTGYLSDMTIQYKRRSSKSLFSDYDDDLSVSDMGSVMSFDRDDESIAGASVANGSVMSSRTGQSMACQSMAGSRKSQGVASSVKSRRSRGLRVGKLIKKISLRRKCSDESSQATRSTRSNFISRMLAKRGTKKEIEPWRALDSASPSYWADHVDSTVLTVERTPPASNNCEGAARRIKRRASM